MAHRVPRRLFLPFLIVLGILCASLPSWSLGTGQPKRQGAERVVYLAGGLSDEGIISLTANVAASGHSGVVLIDSTKWTEQQKQFLHEFQPQRVVPVGTFPDGMADLERRLAPGAAARLSAAQQRVNPGDQLAHAERLAHVIIRSEIRLLKRRFFFREGDFRFVGAGSVRGRLERPFRLFFRGRRERGVR